MQRGERRWCVGGADKLTAATPADAPALRFFVQCAERLVELSNPLVGQWVLDVGTGTGVAALAAAARVGPLGQVIGVDLAKNLLMQARTQATAGVARPDFRLGDVARLDFPDDYFDLTLGAATIVCLPDMLVGLREWVRVTRHGGRVAVSGFGSGACQPLLDSFERRLRRYGVALPSQARPFSWQRLPTVANFCRLLHAAGLVAVEARQEQHGYWLRDAADWWEIVWHSSLRGPVTQLAPGPLANFKAEHLADVAEHATPQGLWLDIPAIFASGEKP